MKQTLRCRQLAVALVCISAGIGISGCEYADPLPATAEQQQVNTELCDTLNLVTYTNQVRAIFSANCYECHSTTQATAGVILDTYDGVKRQIDRGLIPGVIRRDPGFKQMPFGRPKIDDCQIRTIEIWIEAGALNN